MKKIHKLAREVKQGEQRNLANYLLSINEDAKFAKVMII